MKHPDDHLEFSFISEPEVVPQGDGSVLVRPGKVQINAEINAKQAARILNMDRSTLCRTLDKPLAQKTIKWRWMNEAKGKRLFDKQSVLRYKELTRDSEFGSVQG